MVKNGKGGRVMNPADAFRKAERKKEIARNKAERKFVRDAGQKKDTPAELRDELAALIDAEQAAPLSKLQKIRKKVLQEAYDGALKRQKEEELKRKREADASDEEGGGGAAARPNEEDSWERPEESPWFHPLRNPSGLPPPGHHHRHNAGAAAAAAAGLPPGVPLLPPPPGPPPPVVLLPPPPGPPPAAPLPLTLAPPMAPPPPLMMMRPPPGAFGGADGPAGAGPGSSSLFGGGGGRLPPPMAPPPSYASAPAAAAPAAAPLAPPPGPPPTTTAAAAARPTITGASTVPTLPKAQNDRRVTAMVPATVAVRREQKRPPPRHAARDAIGPGFGLAPAPRATALPAVGAVPPGPPPGAPGGVSGGVSGKGMDSKLAEFMDSLKDLGAF